MASAVPTWILFTCCVLNSWISVSLEQGATVSKPSIQVVPSNVIIKGGNFTIRCKGPLSGVRFILYRGAEVVRTLDPPGDEAAFHFTNVQQRDSGPYACRYNPTSDLATYSDASDIINIEVRATFPKPLLQVSPGNVIVRGGTLTFHCAGEQPNMRFTLRHGATEVPHEPRGNKAVFTVTDVQQTDDGRYDCFYHTKSAMTVYSDPSDSIQILVRDDDDDATKIPAPTEEHDATKVPAPTEESSDDGDHKGKTPGPRDENFTQINIVQAVLTAVVLLILLVILAEHFYSIKSRKKESAEQES